MMASIDTTFRQILARLLLPAPAFPAEILAAYQDVIKKDVWNRRNGSVREPQRLGQLHKPGDDSEILLA